jgi:uncharacterized protein YcbX
MTRADWVLSIDERTAVATIANEVGTIAALWRYPVKSMAGEQLDAVELGERGLVGDRGRALFDTASGKIVSAKNPRKWPSLLDCHVSYVAPPRPGSPLPAVCITLPNGARVATDKPDAERMLSQCFGHEVRLATSPTEGQQIEMMLPEDPTEQVLEVPISPVGFFDLAAVHLLTTASLRALANAAPDSRIDVRRFRPNLVIELPARREGFVESEWIGQTLAIGDRVRLSIIAPCPRCIMTSVSQGDLPKDAGVLRAAVEKNEGNFGVYAMVAADGIIRRGDSLKLV